MDTKISEGDRVLLISRNIACVHTHSSAKMKAVNNHWTGLLDWTTGLDYWTTNLTTRFQLRSKKFYLKSVLAVKLL